MNLQGIKPGDIVRVDDGLLWYGVVRDAARGSLHVQLLVGSRANRHVTSRQVTGHWRKTAATRKREQERSVIA